MSQYSLGRAAALTLCVAFITGVLAGARCGAPLLFAGVLVVALAVGLVLVFAGRGALFLSLAVAVAAMALGAYAAALASDEPADSVSRILDAVVPGEEVPLLLGGVAREEVPRAADSSGAYRRYLLAVREVEWAGRRRSASGQVHLYTPKPLPFGSRVEVHALLVRPAPARNPGQFDYAAYLWRNGIAGMAFAPHEGLITVKEQRRALEMFLPWLVVRLKAGFAGRIGLLGLCEGGVMPAVLLGERQGLSIETTERFVRSGTMHLLAVSGLHLGVVVGFVWCIVSFMRAPRLATAAAIFTAVAYALVAGARPPVVRAALMAVLFALTVLLYRRWFVLSVLSTTALVMLLWRPLDIFDPGFQMSFVAVLGLFYIGRPLAQRLESLAAGRPQPYASTLRMMTARLSGALGWSLGAWLSVAPLAAWHFNIVTPVGPLANLLLVPAAAAMVIAGFMAVAASLVSWRLAGLLALSAQGAEGTLLAAADLFQRVPGGHFYVRSFGWGWLFATLGFLALCAALAAGGRRVWHAVVAGLLCANAVVYGALTTPRPEGASVAVLAEGAASAVVLADGAGENILFVPGAAGEDFAGRVIAPFLIHSGHGGVDLLVETAGADARIERQIAMRVPVGAVLRQRRFRSSEKRLGGGRLFGPGDMVETAGGAVIRFHSGRAEDFGARGSPYYEGLIIEVELAGRRIVIALDVTRGCLEAVHGRVRPRPDVLIVGRWRAGNDAMQAWRRQLEPGTFADAGAPLQIDL